MPIAGEPTRSPTQDANAGRTSLPRKQHTAKAQNLQSNVAVSQMDIAVQEVGNKLGDAFQKRLAEDAEETQAIKISEARSRRGQKTAKNDKDKDKKRNVVYSRYLRLKSSQDIPKTSTQITSRL